MMIYQCLICMVIVFTSKLCQDYWSEDFDVNKNCEDEELIQKLQKEKNQPRCAYAHPQNGASSDEDSHQWEECKKYLSRKLVKQCKLMNIEKTGDLLYCKIRGKTSCCYHNESCSKNYGVVHDRMTRQSLKFLNDSQDFVEDMVTNLNYDTCHAITNNDATKCAEDCKQLEMEDFAKDCGKNGGLFKCCIRRDKEFCHDCRFCCTLSVCTSHKGTVYKGSKNLTKHKHTHQNINSKIGFETDQKMWKAHDYRCLKPIANLKPEDWPHYEMNGYRNAKTRQELESVQEIKFDKYFFNFEDPFVFKEMINGTRKEILWKKTYGFDFVSFNDNKKKSGNYQLPCYINCFKAEQRRFARNCKKKGGLFKCCMSTLVLDKFEYVQNELIQKEQIQGAKTNFCTPNGRWNTCYMCAISHICAVKDPFTGRVEETFKTPYTNLQHKIGGRNTGHGLKYWACHVQETCKGKQIGTWSTGMNLPQEDFQRASTREEFCNLTQHWKDSGIKREEPFQTEYYEECLKQDSPNVFICPDIEYLRQSNDVAYVTHILWKLRNKMRRKLKKTKNKSSMLKKKIKRIKSSNKKKGAKQVWKSKKYQKRNRRQNGRKGRKSRKKIERQKTSRKNK